MYKISKNDWDKIDADYKGEWMDYQGTHPEWKGKKVVMSIFVTHNPNETCGLLIEGVHFEIV